jgi:methylated-DNA-[protein]-cysteine S-methyltransferase
MTARFDTFPTPVGPITIVVDDNGAVSAAAFGGVDDLPAPVRRRELEPDSTATAAGRQQVEEYFAGTRQDFDVPLAPQGSAFQSRFWRELAAVPYGTTRTYGAMAAELGSSPRAIGRANATNPICLILPCHRVIGSDGSLTGYAYGIEIKQRLLDHERRVAGVAPALV